MPVSYHNCNFIPWVLFHTIYSRFHTTVCNHTTPSISYRLRGVSYHRMVQFHTKQVGFHTKWGGIHTWNKFIHTKIEQIIPHEWTFTLNLRTSRPRDTNGTHTHRQTGTRFRSLRKSLHLSRQISLSWRTLHWCACTLQLARPFAPPLHAARWWSPSAQTYSSRNQYDMCG